MKYEDTSDHAFPGYDSYQHSMTLRDYFAAEAMQGLSVAFPDWSHDEIARASYAQADAMLEARKS